MKTNRLYVLTTIDPRRDLFRSKLFMFAIVIAVILSLLPVATVFAAPASAADFPSDTDLEGEWKDKIQNVRAEGFFYVRVRVYPADFKDLAELARANELLNNYGAAYKAAQTLIFNHSGFDANGQVINEIQADESIKDVAEQLHTMYGLRKKLDELEGNYRLLPFEAITITSAQ